MAFNYIVPLRIVQVLLAVIDIGLSAYVASWYNTESPHPSPSQVNFLVFTSIWTALLTLPYLTLSPRFFPPAAHKYGILAAEALTMIFWFSAFISTGVFLAGLKICTGQVCGAARAAVAFAAFEWLTFGGTTAMAVVHVFRTTAGSGDFSNRPVGKGAYHSEI